MLQVDALKKSYGALLAVNGVSLHAEAGEIVGEVYWRCQPIWRSGPVR